MSKFIKLIEKELNKNSDKEIKFEDVKLNFDSKTEKLIDAQLASHQASIEKTRAKKDWNNCM